MMLDVTDASGMPVDGAAVTVTVRARRIRWNGSTVWDTSTVQGTIGPGGSLQVETGPWKRSGSNRITQVTYEVTEVTVPDDGSWDGQAATVSFDAP